MASSSTTTATMFVKRATAAYNASQFDQAVEHSRAALIMLNDTSETTAQELLDEAYERLVLSYQRTGSFGPAREATNEWITRTKRPQGKVLATIHHARLADYLGSHEEAARLADQAIDEADRIGFKKGVGFAKRIRADMLWKRGQTEESLRLGQEALALLEQIGELEQQAAARVSLAAAYHSSGQFYKSIQQLQRTVRIMEQLGRKFELAIAYSNLGETYAELFAMEKALEAHQKAIQLVGDQRAHEDLVRNYGVDLIAVGRTEEGRKYLTRALDKARRVSNPDSIAQALYSLAEANLQAGQNDEAEAQGTELLAIAEHTDSLRHRIRAWLILGRVAQRQGDHERAQTLLNECSMAAQQSVNRHAIWKTHAALHDLLRESAPQLAEIHRRIAAEMMTNILAGIEDDDLRNTFRSAEAVKSVLGDEA